MKAFRAVFDEPVGVPATFPTVAEFTVIPRVVADPELGIDFPACSTAARNTSSAARSRRGRRWSSEAGSSPSERCERHRLPRARDRAGRAERGDRLHRAVDPDRADGDVTRCRRRRDVTATADLTLALTCRHGRGGEGVRGRGGRSEPAAPGRRGRPSSGFPGIIAHGMFTMGHIARPSWRGRAGPDRVRRLSAQFRAPVFMGEEIVAGWSREVGRRGTRSRGAGMLGHGRARRHDGVADQARRGRGPATRPGLRPRLALRRRGAAPSPTSPGSPRSSGPPRSGRRCRSPRPHDRTALDLVAQTSATFSIASAVDCDSLWS